MTQPSRNQSDQNSFQSENNTLRWAGPDSDRRPSARQADVLTRLDDRPTYVADKLSASDIFIGFAQSRQQINPEIDIDS